MRAHTHDMQHASCHHVWAWRLVVGGGGSGWWWRRRRRRAHVCVRVRNCYGSAASSTAVIAFIAGPLGCCGSTAAAAFFGALDVKSTARDAKAAIRGRQNPRHRRASCPATNRGKIAHRRASPVPLVQAVGPAAAAGIAFPASCLALAASPAVGTASQASVRGDASFRASCLVVVPACPSAPSFHTAEHPSCLAGPSSLAACPAASSLAASSLAASPAASSLAASSLAACPAESSLAACPAASSLAASSLAASSLAASSLAASPAASSLAALHPHLELVGCLARAWAVPVHVLRTSSG